MAVHLDLGKKGEELAALFLMENGYTILFRNWRYSYYEIDIIAVKNGLLHFIEIKVRATKKYGFPEQNVTKKKIRFLLNAADQFLYLNPEYRHFQLDILSIIINKYKPPEFFLIEDVYE